MNIILFEESDLTIPLSRKDRRARHILKVLRLEEGDHFQMGLINGPRGTAQITAITQQTIAFNYALTDDIPQLHPIKMVIGMTRPRYARRILKDVTSQGASELHFVATDTGEKSYHHSTLWTNEGYRPHLIEGAEQAFCTQLPIVKLHLSLADCLTSLGQETDRVALDNYEADCTLQDYRLHSKNVIVAIGSERGWSSTERDQFRHHAFTLAHMGKRVLKTETACVSALAIVLSKLGV